MKHLNIVFSLFAILSLATITGCKNDPQTDPINPRNVDTPAINITTEAMEIDPVNGDYTIYFSISNPHPSITAVVKCDAEWITITETTNDYVKFSALANTSTQSRSADIVIKYIDTEDKTVVVTQRNVEGDILTITPENVTYNEFTTKVASADPNMYYVHYMSEVSYFTGMNIDSEEALIYDDNHFFQQYAGMLGYNLKTFMEEFGIVHIGNKSVDWERNVPANRYVAYAYGIRYNDDNSDYTVTTPIYYTIVETPINDIGTQEFGIDVAVDGADIEYSINANGYSGKYAVMIYSSDDDMYLAEGNAVDEAYTIASAQEWMKQVNTALYSREMSNEDIYEMYCYIGDAAVYETLVANKEYMIAVFAVDEVDGLPMLTTTPVVKHFSTSEVAKSDMKFDFTYNYVYSGAAEFVIIPSTDEDYTFLLVKTENLPDFVSNNDLIDWAISSYWLEVYNGEYTYSSSYLTPDTEYSILVFGYHGEAATTDLSRFVFRTEPAAASLCNITGIEFNGPYDPVAIADLDPAYDYFRNYGGYFVMWMTTHTDNEEDCIAKYHYLYDTATVANYGYDGIFADLTYYSYEDYYAAAGAFDTEYVIASAVQDYKGNYSDMVYSEPFTYDASQLRDAQEFVDAMSNDTRSNVQVIFLGRDKITTLPLQK